MKKGLVTLLILLIQQTSVNLYAQDTLDVHLDTAVVVEFTYGSSPLFDFPNVNRVPYYYNPKEIKKIRHYEERQDWEKLYPVLKDYVTSFGIENFYKSTYWLWRLAKLTELFGNQEEARLLYNLALKHYRNNLDVNKIELYYDSITSNTQDYYVPIEYYYELVNYRQLVDTLRPPRGMLLNMGPKINSPRADYGPSLSGNDQLMIFTTKREVSKNPMDPQPIENIYYTIRDGNMWLRAKPVEGLLRLE